MTLKQYGHLSIEDRGRIQILIPGAGLGRIPFDLAKEGFSAQGNEFSYFMLIASDFILNQ
jgi:carnosine N-methyltransferase